MNKSVMYSGLGLALALMLGGCGKQSQEAVKAVQPLEKIPQSIKDSRAAATKIYTAKSVVTMDAEAEVAGAVAVKEGRIVGVGSLDELKAAVGEGNYIVDATFADKTIMPGFIEQHLHPVLGALTLSHPIIAPEPWELPGKTWPAATTHEAYMTALKKLAADMPANSDKPLLTWGYSQFFHGKMSRKMLDEVSDTLPIIIWHRSAHEFYLNTAALKRYGIDAANIKAAGEEIAAQSDFESGHFYENGAFMYIVPKILPDMGSKEFFVQGLKQMLEILHNNGVTAYNEPGALMNERIAALYQSVLGADDVPMYSFFTPESKTLYAEYGAEGMLKATEEKVKLLPETGKVRYFKKQIKLLADGAIISQLMQMKDGYTDGHKGEWIQRPEELEAVTKVYWDAGYQILIHVNGDEGLEQVLNVIERRMKENPRKDHRTTIIHFANSTPEQVKRIKALGCIVSANPYYVTAFADKYAEVGLGPERAGAMVRLAPVEALNVPISLHSDMPMAPSDPLYLAWSAATRHTLDGNTVRPELALSVDGALKGITINAAQSWRMEDELGSIEPGKVANFTILEENPYKVEADHLKDIEIWGTVFEGKAFPINHPK